MNYNWDLTKIFKNKLEWEEAKGHLKEDMTLFAKSLSNMFSSEENFLQILHLKISIDYQIECLYCYPKRFLDLNREDEEHSIMMREAWSIYEEILNLWEEFLSSLKEQTDFLTNFQKHHSYYFRYLQLLTHKNSTDLFSDILFVQELYNTLTEADMKFSDAHDEDGNLISLNRRVYQDLMLCKKREVREEATKKIYQGYQDLNHTFSLLLNKKYSSFISYVSKYSCSSLLNYQMMQDDLSEDIFLRLIKVTNLNLSLAKQYVELKKSILKLEDFTFYDTNLPLGFISKMEFSIEEGVSLIKNALAILGKDYVSIIDKAFLEGWVDVFPNPRKRKMSFSCISYCGVPYASLNYNKSFSSVLTLAHELGHSIHTYYSRQKNAYEYFEYSLFLSEIVSKVNEILLQEYILEQDISLDEKIYLLSQMISRLGNTLFGQTMLSEFEYKYVTSIENKEGWAAKKINACYEEIYSKYNPGVLVSFDHSCGWSLIPHLFCNRPYYLYQYAIGLSIALEIVRKLKSSAGFSKQYIDFLSIGNSQDILSSLKSLGIDLDNDAFLENAFHYFGNLICELNELLT